MPDFSYKARDASGRTTTGTMTAGSANEALDTLRRQNLIVLSLDERRGSNIPFAGLFDRSAKKQVSAKRARVSLQDLTVFTRQLATMLSAGIPLLECLEILAEQLENPGFRAIVQEVVADVRTGSDFSDALRKHPRVFSNIYVNMVRAGEASGQLDEILVRLAEYQEASAALRARIRSAMTYPVVSLVLILTITTGLLVGIIPKFKAIFDGMNIEGGLPWITQTLLDISIWMRENPKIWLGGTALTVALLVLYGKTTSGRYLYDRIKLKLPVFGPLFQKVALSRFSRTFATLIESGVPILGALEIVAATSGNKVIEDAVLESSASVRQGDTLASPLARSGVFPPMVTRMIAIGEKSGALESLLEKISEFYDQQVAATVESLTSLIEPILIAIMGVLVGSMVLAIFLPILKIAGSLS
ncbi:MAG: type II secretion system F family protein [Planctomycetota bacterium]|nr:MAG: type II secretion system F family protein [Planctomycetota bacterium]